MSAKPSLSPLTRVASIPQQRGDALDGGADVVDRVGVGEADEALAVDAEAGAGHGGDTGLLQHWGLKLTVSASSAGKLEGGGICSIVSNGLIARCSIGRGQATVIADADFLNVEDSEALGLDLLVVELARLETR